VEATTNTSRIAELLGLTKRDGDLFFAKICGFPVGLKIIDPLGLPLALFQIRHLLPVNAKEEQSVRYQPEVSSLINEKKVAVEFEDKLAWVTFNDCRELLLNDKIRPLLESVLNSFAIAGFARNPDLCHYCQKERVQELTSFDGKIAQICSTCFDARAGTPENQPAKPGQGVIPIAVLAPLAALVGAVGWALFWVGYDLVFDLLNTKVLVVPRLVELAALVCVAGATGGPIGFVIRRIRKRGKSLSLSFAVVSTLLAAVLGEIVYVTWLIFREFKVVDLSVAWKILPRLESESGGFHLFVKLAAVVCAVVLAAEIAKPPKPKLNL